MVWPPSTIAPGGSTVRAEGADRSLRGHRARPPARSGRLTPWRRQQSSLGRGVCQLAWHARVTEPVPAPAVRPAMSANVQRKSAHGSSSALRRGRACGPDRVRARSPAVRVCHQALLADHTSQTLRRPRPRSSAARHWSTCRGEHVRRSASRGAPAAASRRAPSGGSWTSRRHRHLRAHRTRSGQRAW